MSGDVTQEYLKLHENSPNAFEASDIQMRLYCILLDLWYAVKVKHN